VCNVRSVMCVCNVRSVMCAMCALLGVLCVQC